MTGGIWTQRICYLPLFFVNKLTPNMGSWSRRAVWRLAKKCASSGNAAAPQMVNKVQLDQDIVVWVTTPSIQSTANVPVMPSRASATGPYASPPTMDLVTKPVRIPIVSNHQRASIRRVSPQARRRWNRAATFERDPMKGTGSERILPPTSVALSSPCKDKHFRKTYNYQYF
jgi:hypothetical protein